MRKINGQIVLVVLLVMLVGLTVGLAVIARSVTNLRIATQSEESQRAFSAAEAGIESAILVGQSQAGQIGQATYQVTVKETQGASYLSSEALNPGETQLVWLVTHMPDGTLNETAFYTSSQLDVCWENGALEASILYKSAGKYKISRAASDPDSGRRASNNFSAPDTLASSNCSLTYKKRISLPAATVLAVSLKPYYSETKVGVGAVGDSFLPAQGKGIESTGVSGVTTRKIKTFSSYGTPGTIFDYLLFSGTNLVK